MARRPLLRHLRRRLYRDKKTGRSRRRQQRRAKALFLTRFATHIDLLIGSKLRASDVLQKDLDKAVQEGKITVH